MSSSDYFSNPMANVICELPGHGRLVAAMKPSRPPIALRAVRGGVEAWSVVTVPVSPGSILGQARVK